MDADGETLTDDLGLSVSQVLLRPAYWGKTSSGHPWTLNVVIPILSKKIDSADYDDSGIGDITLVGAYNFYAKDGFFISSPLFIKLPTGSFDKDKALNFGDGQMDIWPQLRVAKLMDKMQFEGTIGYKYRMENDDTNVKPGNELWIEGLFGYQITKTMKLGGEVSLGMGEDSEVNGITANDTAMSSLSIGPQVYYQIDPKMSLVGKFMFDVDSQNYSKGTLFLGRFLYTF